LVLPIIAYTLSSTKLEIRAKYFLFGSEGIRGQRKEVGGWGGKEREMTQTLYAHMNKRNKKKKMLSLIPFSYKNYVYCNHSRLKNCALIVPIIFLIT
jgi:hypothetical protein